MNHFLTKKYMLLSEEGKIIGADDAYEDLTKRAEKHTLETGRRFFVTKNVAEVSSYRKALVEQIDHGTI